MMVCVILFLISHVYLLEIQGTTYIYPAHYVLLIKFSHIVCHICLQLLYTMDFTFDTQLMWYKSTNLVMIANYLQIYVI